MAGALRHLAQAVRVLGTACLAALFVLVVVQVVLRYGFNTTPPFTEEFARYALLWSVLAGMALAVRERSHIRIEFLLDLLPAALRRGWLVLLDVVSIAFFAIMTVTGVQAVGFIHGQRSVELQIPLSYPFVALPLFFALAAVFGVAALLARRRR